MHIIIPRCDIEMGTIGMALSALNTVSVDEEAARKYHNRVVLAFEGYDEDPRGLFQIESVRKFVRKLNREWHSWFFFMTKDLELSPIATLALCCCSTNRRLRSTGLFIPATDELKKYLHFQFAALRACCEVHGFTEKHAEAEIDAWIDYLMRIGWASGCDLPRLSIHSAKAGWWAERMRTVGRNPELVT